MTLPGFPPLLAMIDELNIRPHARKGDPDTSKQAAAQVRVNSIRHGILDILQQHPEGLATFQVANLMGVPRDYISSHFKPLCSINVIRKTGKTIPNPMTKNRTRCEVYIVTQDFLKSPLAKKKYKVDRREKDRARLERLMTQIVSAKAEIQDILSEHVKDFDTLTHEVVFKHCNKSTVGLCVQEISIASVDMGMRCVFCGR